MDFKALIELVQTITRNKIKHIEVLGNSDQKGSMVDSFYDAISKGTITSDESAVKYLYGHNDRKDVAYQRLKNRLVRQLTNTAFFVDVNQPAFNERSKAYFACHRDYAAAFTLLLRGASKAGVYILEKVLEQSIKYEFIELITEISRHLRVQTSRNNVDYKQHQFYVNLHRQYEEKRRLEMLALDYHEELIEYYSIHRSPSQDIAHLASKYFDELLPLCIKADTSRFYYYTYQIGCIKYFAINDCYSVLTLIEEALPLLESRKNTNRSMLQLVVMQKLVCLTQLRIFEDNIGENIFNYCLTLCTNEIFNWFRTMESYFYYLTYQQKYAQSFKIFDDVINHPQFSYLEGSFRDNWLLLGGYLHLLATLGKLDPVEVENIVGPYRYGRLLNEVKVVGKDRQGMNIPLILLPILFSLAKGNYQDYGRSKEALDKYRQRYLENEINQRSAVFVNMLMALDKKSYDPKSAEQRIQNGLTALKQGQPQVIGQYFTIEIIPYEDLWAMLVEKMKT